MSAGALVSIIIPARDAAAVIRNSVTSVLKQSYTNLEVIVVDNGSLDETCATVRELSRMDKRVRLVESECTGVSHARNMGIEEAKGDYIAFCDADDEMEQGSLSILLEHASMTDIVAGGMSFDVIDKRGNIISSLARQVAVPINVQGAEISKYFEELWDANYLQSCCSKLYSAEYLKQIGARFDEGLSSYEDLAFVLDCLSHGASFTAIPDICYRYFRSTFESNSTRYKPNMTDQMQRVSERIVSFCKETLGKVVDTSCAEHVIQLLVVAINNAQSTSGDKQAIRGAISDVFARRIFIDAIGSADRYPNRYSRLVCNLGVKHCYGLISLLARLRNWMRGKRAARC